MSSIFIEFVRLVNLKKYGKALQMATIFTDDVEEFHNKISLNKSAEIMNLVLNNLKIPLQNWRDFLEDHFYFDDVELMRKWIDVEKKYLRQKWDFLFDQRAYRSELGSCKFAITIYAYHNDYSSADKKWIRVKEVLPKIMDDEVKEKWRRFEIIYVLWKKDYEEGRETSIVKLIGKMKDKVEKLVKESSNLLNQGKIIQSFGKQTKIVKLIEKHLSKVF